MKVQREMERNEGTKGNGKKCNLGKEGKRGNKTKISKIK